jgi:hypothetical protein
MHRGLVAALIGTAIVGSSTFVAGAPAGASGPAIKVSPARGLTNNQTITISGSGLGKTKHGSRAAWFASECTTKAIGVRSLDPDYSPHCAPTLVQALSVSPTGRFSAHFPVATGKVADGVCGVPGHMTCIIAVGNAAGLHRTATIRFKSMPAPKPPRTTTTTKPKSP